MLQEVTIIEKMKNLMKKEQETFAEELEDGGEGKGGRCLPLSETW